MVVTRDALGTACQWLGEETFKLDVLSHMAQLCTVVQTRFNAAAAFKACANVCMK